MGDRARTLSAWTVLPLAIAAMVGCTADNAPRTRRPVPVEATRWPTLHPPRQQCPPIAPRQLPDGSRPGPARELGVADDLAYAWGSGRNRVVQDPGEDVLGILDLRKLEQVRGRGWTARWIFVGDPGVGQVVFAFSVGDCPYTVWLAGGTRAPKTREYIARY